MQKNIALIYGDCSSPEIVTQAVRVLDNVAEKFGHTFTYTRAYMGGEAIDKFGDPLPQSELDKCLASDSVLLGAVGGPKWEGMAGDKRPEKGLLRLRAGMGLYANNRPARIWPQLADASPLKKEIVDKGIDFIVVRELIGGVYFGEHKTIEQNGEKVAIDSMPYSEHEIERIGRIGFETAMKRRKKLTCVDKANVLDTSRLWRAVMHRLQAEYPEVEYSEMFVDNCAMQICKNPLDAAQVLREVGLKDRMGNFPAQLSGGEQQRVSIARALAKNPKLLLCDEPTGALDYQTGKAILKLLQDMCREKGMTVIVITHNSALTPMADRVIHIKNGTVSSMELNDHPTPVEEIEW